MKQLLYNIDALLIIGVLFVLMFAAIEAGYRFGVRRKDSATEMTRDHLSAIQASILGVMGLLLAFTMLVAVTAVHLPNGFFLPNGYEFAFTLLLATGALALTGAAGTDEYRMLAEATQTQSPLPAK